MSTRDTMELREETIRAQYEAALGLITGFDHAPRLAKAIEAAAVERSAGIGTRPRFRSTVPGMVTRSPARPGGVRLAERVEGLGDGLLSPLQASALNALRRALAVALAGELELEVVETLLGLAEPIPLLAEGLDLSPPQLEGGFLLPLGR